MTIWKATTLLIAALFLSVSLLSTPVQAQTTSTTPSITVPLTTHNGQIIDATGKPIVFRGVNWFGFEVDTNVAHGLWVRDYKSMMAQIKALGFNSIRVPYSLQSIRANSINSVNYSLGANQELQGLTSIQVMDKFIQAAADEGLLVLLDSHRHSSYSIPELWHGDGYTEQDWIDTWKLLANRYKNQWNVIGADLKNEPHGGARWGNDSVVTDWRLAAERAGNEILAIAPNWLIMVEGVEGPLPGQQLPGHWWGGNLEAAGQYPVRLSKPSQLIYSVHEYGEGVSPAPWFYAANFPQNMLDRWQKGFYYLVETHKVPVVIGEFGGRNVDMSSKEGIWQNYFVDYLRDKSLSFFYWSFNPNSSDTGGILTDDWTNVHGAKMEMLNRLLSQPFPAPTEGPAPSPTPVVSPSPNVSPSPSVSPNPSASPTASASPSPSGSPSGCTTSADFNQDGNVNLIDFSILAAKFFQTSNIAQQDLNCDGQINLADYSLFVRAISF